ncbi:MAG TPA: glycosyltransferase family 1 protein [Terriglobales bacterium]|nr:glycosyltransferase family 1 protein [Terriglobales bacterium]
MARHWHRWTGVSARGCRVWHCLHQDSRYWPRERRTPVVLTLHDLNFLKDEDRGRRERRLRALQRRVERAAVVTAISQSTADIARAHLRLADHRPLAVIYNGNPLDPESEEERPGWAPAGRFLLSVAHLHPKKNQLALLPLLTARPDLTLVLAGEGKPAYVGELRRAAERLGVAGRVVLPGVIGPKVKLWLLRRCEALVFPSLAEGFGLPVVEAMSVGKPVFLSRSDSLPEVGGEAAFYWEDFAPAAMAARLESGLATYAADPGLAGRLRAQAQRFQWEAAARRYITLYREAGGWAGDSMAR